MITLKPPSTWKTLLLVYSRIDVKYAAGWFQRARFTHDLTEGEVLEAVASFQQFPSLVDSLTSGAAKVDSEIIYAKRPLTTLTRLTDYRYWPSPDDTRAELNEFLPRGGYRSVLVLWPQNNLAAKTAIPTGGWGLGLAASEWSHGATYATVTNVASWAWNIPTIGEVWLHEWLHGVTDYFAHRGCIIPDGGADGGGRHGYVQSRTTGWMDYYRDLMTGHVPENGKLFGITPEAWQEDGVLQT
jgi:hypothetical protein